MNFTIDDDLQTSTLTIRFGKAGESMINMIKTQYSYGNKMVILNLLIEFVSQIEEAQKKR
jgi:hypothetical protein